MSEILTVEALRSAIETRKDPGRIEDAVVWLRRRQRQPDEYRLYVRVSWAEDYRAIAVHRGKALRVHKTFEPWVALLDAFGYVSKITVYRDQDPQLLHLGITDEAAA